MSIKMGRKKFEIKTDIDSINLSMYLQKWQNIIISEYCEDEKNTEINCQKLRDVILVLCREAEEGADPQDMYWLQTYMLNLLSEKKRQTIRTTLRANRKKRQNKKQLTINSNVYMNLKKYSESKKVTLSDAIESLLLLKNSVN